MLKTVEPSVSLYHVPSTMPVWQCSATLLRNRNGLLR
jgi:hypothetical protein